jgi:hypothetical protein
LTQGPGHWCRKAAPQFPATERPGRQRYNLHGRKMSVLQKGNGLVRAGQGQDIRLEEHRVFGDRREHSGTLRFSTGQQAGLSGPVPGAIAIPWIPADRRHSPAHPSPAESATASGSLGTT